MCQECVDVVQERMDKAIAVAPPERLIIHLDDFDSATHGEEIDRDAVEEALHLDHENCWCRPLIVEPSETRSAAELLADWYSEHPAAEVTQ